MEAKTRKARARKHFFERVMRAGECLLWSGSKDYDGYGRFWYEGRGHQAHRVAYYFEHGVWPTLVRHTCDTPSCVESAHLLSGTPKDNSDDAYARGRKNNRGSDNGFSKLTEADVFEIRAKYATGSFTQTQLANQFNVHQAHVSEIVNHIIWRHV